MCCVCFEPRPNLQVVRRGGSGGGERMCIASLVIALVVNKPRPIYTHIHTRFCSFSHAFRKFEAVVFVYISRLELCFLSFSFSSISIQTNRKLFRLFVCVAREHHTYVYTYSYMYTYSRKCYKCISNA